MFELIVDGKDRTARGAFEYYRDASSWFDLCIKLGACSLALWKNGKCLLKFYVKEKE